MLKAGAGSLQVKRLDQVMRSNRARLPVYAFCMSVVIHAMMLAALPLAIDAASPRWNVQAQLPEIQVLITPEVQLGLNEDLAPSENWLGDVEPELHLAQQDLVEQAAFVTSDAAPVDSPVPHTPQIPAPEMLTPTTIVAINEPVENAEQRNEAQAMQSLHAAIISPQPHADVAAASEARLEMPLPDPADLLLAKLHESLKQADSAPHHELTSDKVKQQSSNEASPAPAVPSAAAGEPGTPADKESMATSIVNVPREHWRLGKPLASEGLELKPRRPEFTLLTLVTAAPGNPLCQIDFDRHGVPVTAALLTATGDRRVDDALLASLYRWRAEGEALQQLSQGQTLSVQIRILLTRSRSDS